MKNCPSVKFFTDPVGSNLFGVSGECRGGEIGQQDAKLTPGTCQKAFDLPA
jgi:hypothetical protein